MVRRIHYKNRKNDGWRCCIHFDACVACERWELLKQQHRLGNAAGRIKHTQGDSWKYFPQGIGSQPWYTASLLIEKRKIRPTARKWSTQHKHRPLDWLPVSVLITVFIHLSTVHFCYCYNTITYLCLFMPFSFFKLQWVSTFYIFCDRYLKKNSHLVLCVQKEI